MAIRVGLGLVCALALAGCASATAFRVERSDVIGPCQTAVPAKAGHDVQVLNDDGTFSARGRRPATAPGSSSTRRS